MTDEMDGEYYDEVGALCDRIQMASVGAEWPTLERCLSSVLDFWEKNLGAFEVAE